MSKAPYLSVVVAVKDADANLNDLLSNLPQKPDDRVEYLFVVAGEPSPALVMTSGRARVLVAPIQALVPHLWRDGIYSARGAAIGLTTAQCLPSSGWVERLLAADLKNYAGVGGTIGLDATCDAARAAMYLLRYLTYAPPQQRRTVKDIAADNAIYRRADILQEVDLLVNGFWEPSFHRRFAARGERMQLDPTISVTYRGQERAADFARLRFHHGLEFGSSRGARLGRRRAFGMLLASPLLPLLLLTRIIWRAWRHPRVPTNLWSALPWLCWYALAWSTGEARGYLNACGGTDSPLEPPR